MSRFSTCGGFLVLIAFVDLALAVEVKVVKKPVPETMKAGDGQKVTYSWTVSYSRLNSPTTFELDMPDVTEQQANAEAEALKAWNQRMGKSDWNLHTILLEGEPSVRSKDHDRIVEFMRRARELADQISELKEKLDAFRREAKERAVGDTLKEYAKAIQDVYQRVVDLKSELTGWVGKITSAMFDQVNNLINGYNGLPIQYNGVADAGNKKIFPVVILLVSIDVPQQRDDSVSVKAVPKPSPLPSRYYTAQFGQRQLGVQLQNDGTMTVTDPADNNKQLVEGRWAQHRDKLHLSTSSYVYIGQVDGTAAKGLRFQVGSKQSTAGESWNLKPGEKPAGFDDFVGTWVPEGETGRGDARTGAPGVVKDRIIVRSDRKVSHHDVYYGVIRCQASFNGNSITLSHDKGWGGQDARWKFTGTLKGDKIEGNAIYVDGDKTPRAMVFVRSN